MRRTLSLTLIFMLFIAQISTANWQGTGNFTQDNITFIRTNIDANFNSQWSAGTITDSSDKTLVNLAKKLSDQLNDQWAPAWNVVIALTTDSSYNMDTVLYGYGFRDHWMWDNTYKVKDGQAVGFIIWKDYNCINWVSYSQNGVPQYSGQGTYTGQTKNSITSAIYTLGDDLNMNEVWNAAKAISDLLHTNQNIASYLGTNKAFTVVLSQS